MTIKLKPSNPTSSVSSDGAGTVTAPTDNREAPLGLTSSSTASVVGSYRAVYPAMFMVLFGIPIYLFLKAQRERIGHAVEPIGQVDRVEFPVSRSAGSH